MSNDTIRWVEIIGGSIISAIVAIIGFMFARRKEKEANKLDISSISLKWTEEFKKSFDECSDKIDKLTETIDKIKTENNELKITTQKQKERIDEQDAIIKTQKERIDAQDAIINAQQLEIESLKPKRRKKTNEV